MIPGTSPYNETMRVRAGQPSIPAIETVVVDVIEEPIPGVTVVSEFEATEVRKAGAGREEPEEGHSAPRNQKNHENCIASPALA